MDPYQAKRSRKLDDVVDQQALIETVYVKWHKISQSVMASGNAVYMCNELLVETSGLLFTRNSNKSMIT